MQIKSRNLIVILALFSLFGVSIAGWALAIPQTTLAAVQAAETADGPIFLPLVTNQHPYDSLFGVDLGIIRDANGLSLMDKAGTLWLRRGDYYWSKVEPTKGARNWGAVAALETEFVRAAQTGMKVILPIYHTPTWAQKVSGSYCGPIKPTEYQAFASFIYDVVKRYSQPPFKIQYFEIWNEPDVLTAISDQGFGCLIEDLNKNGVVDSNEAVAAGGAYANLLKVVYPAVKAANPDAQLLVGGLLMGCDPDNPPAGATCAETSFFDGILANQGGSSFDGVSFHTYDYYYGDLNWFGNTNWNAGRFSKNENLSTIEAKSGYLRNRMNQYGVTGKFIMDTEMALLCDKDCDSVYEETKANFVAQAYVKSLALAFRSNIWYNSLGTWRNSGLLYSDLTPRPAYYTYQFVNKEMGGAVYRRAITEFPGVKGYEFLQSGRMTWVLWSYDGDPHSVSLSSTPVVIKDLNGNSLGNPTNISVTPAPVFIAY